MHRICFYGLAISTSCFHYVVVHTSRLTDIYRVHCTTYKLRSSVVYHRVNGMMFYLLFTAHLLHWNADLWMWVWLWLHAFFLLHAIFWTNFSSFSRICELLRTLYSLEWNSLPLHITSANPKHSLLSDVILRHATFSQPMLPPTASL